MTDPREPEALPGGTAGPGPDPDARVAAAFDSYFAKQLAPVSFKAMDPADLVPVGELSRATRAHRRPARRGRLLLAAAAALLLVAGIGVAGWWNRVHTITGVPAPTSSPSGSATTSTAWDPVAGEWSVTAPSPLGPRYDALAFHADGRYYVLGGYTGLTYEILNNDQDLHGEPALDGAGYDPATNTWTTLPSLAGLFPWVTASSAATVVDGRLYVVTPLGAPGHVYSGSPPATGERAAAVLDLRAGGGWRELPAPPATSARADQLLLGTSDGLFLFADNPADGSAADDYVYEFSTGAWEPLPRPPQQSLESRRVAPLDATHVLLSTGSAPDADGREIPGGYAVLDLTTRVWRPADLPSFDNPPSAVVDGVAAFETWGAREDSPPAVAACSFAGVGGATKDACVTLELTWEQAHATGGLAARLDDTGGQIVQRPLSTGTAVSVHHKLFDPRTDVLWQVPALPGVHYPENSTDGDLNGVVMAAGGGSLFSCFGYTAQPEQQTLVNHDECYLLPVPDPLPGDRLR